MFVSFMQVAIHQSLDGTYGIAGWRWLYVTHSLRLVRADYYSFIFNAIMTVIVAAAGFFLVCRI
jgi:hypothetical protein